MWRICSRTLVGMVKPVSVTQVAGRNLIQKKGLPRPPVPPLRQSCELYLHFLEPLMEEDELKRTKELVEEFQRKGGVGERLQRGLEKKAQTAENWVTDAFLKKIYLTNRFSPVCHSTFAMIHPRRRFRNRKDHLRFAAEIISDTVELKRMVDNEELPVDHVKGRPMCMKQYESLFSSCRIPGLEIDTMEFYSKSSNPPKHITVAHNGHLFVMDVYNTDGTPLTVDQLCVQLEKICTSSIEVNTEPVGILTSQHRDVWTKSYNNLIKDETNKESLSAIQRSIFIVSLERATTPVSDEQTVNDYLQALHGGGSHANSGNRWLDKGLQLITGEDGNFATKNSHISTDGIVMMAVNDYFTETRKRRKEQVVQSPTDPLPLPQKLQFNLTPELKKDIEEAKQHIDKMAHDFEVQLKVFKHFGKDAIKVLKINPNTFLQMAIQLAFYRINQRCCSTLEPATLRFFNLGRLGSINSTSPASASFVKAFDDPKKQTSEKINLLEKAIEAHRWYTKMVLKGQDVESHFMGLKVQAEEEQIPMPDLFTDISYAKAFDYKVTTTQVASKSGNVGIIHPLPGVWQVGYGILNDRINLNVTSIKDNNGANAGEMIPAVEHALLDLKTMLDQRSA